jgi:hypothetical protein
MPGPGDAGNPGERKPREGGPGGQRPGPGPGGRKSGRPPAPTPPRRTGGLNIRRIGGNDFEIVHPRCVQEMELDYEEGMELWKAGDPEAARDALRFALQGCGDNIWVHIALGRIALADFNDPGLARGHFGYAFELAERAIPPGFSGRLPRDRFPNRPFYEAIEGLATCYDALGKPEEAKPLRALAERLGGRSGPDRRPLGDGGHRGGTR